MAVVGAKAKDGFGGPGMGIPGNGNNYTKHQIKCHEVSPTFQYLITIFVRKLYNYNDMWVCGFYEKKNNHNREFIVTLLVRNS